MKDHHRPLARHRVVSSISFALLLTAFILFLLVAVSLPILKPVYILQVQSTSTGQPATSLATELRFGVWGVCASSVLNQPTLVTNNGVCFGPQLGYQVPPEINHLVTVPPAVVQAIERGLLFILVLHPIAAAFAFLGFLMSLFLASHAMAIITLLFAIVSAIVGTVVFAIDLALVIVARNALAQVPDLHFAVTWGDAVWMVLGAVIATWLAVLFLSARACYCCGVRRHHHHHHPHSSY